MADEPFLEAALDDRGKTVRRAAADLLPRLTEFCASPSGWPSGPGPASDGAARHRSSSPPGSAIRR